MAEAPGVLNLQPNLADADGVYEALIETHRGLSPEQSALLNAKLILLLANHIGDETVLRAAMSRAREGLVAANPDDTIAAVA